MREQRRSTSRALTGLDITEHRDLLTLSAAPRHTIAENATSHGE